MARTHQGVIARVVGAGVAATAAFGYFSAGAANADTFVPLPDTHMQRVLGDGTVAHIDITGESANINPSMVSTPLSRNVWTGGHAQVNLTGGAANDPKTHTKFVVGYVVGCQVDLSSGVTGEADGTGTASTSDGSTSYSGTGTGEATLTLAAGQAKSLYLLDIEKPDDFGTDTHYKYQNLKGPHQSLTWHDETFAVDGCGGYAQARSFARAQIYTPHGIGYATAWGKPFSIG